MVLSVKRPLSRFTPAYAGNTKIRVKFITGNGVHPRIRGEY